MRFYTYNAQMKKIWVVNFLKANWESESTCSCPVFLKSIICKHIIGLAIKLNLYEVCSEAKSVPIGQKRKRGRPIKASAALIVD